VRINNFLIFSFVLFSLLHQLIGDKDDLFYLRVAQAIGLVSFVRVMFLKWSEDPFFRETAAIRSVKLILAICVISSMMIEFAHSRFYFLNLIYPISFGAVSMLVYVVRPSVVPFVTLSVLVQLWVFSKFFAGLSPNDWVKGSRNYVSVVVMYTVLVPFLIAKLRPKEDWKTELLFLSMGALALSVFALGRSGILACLMLVGVNVYNGLRGARRVFSVGVILIVVSFASYWVYVNLDSISSVFLYKFETRGFESQERSMIIKNYFDRLDAYSLLFSYPDITRFLTVHGITLHNSYLHWHFSYGIGAVLVLNVIVGAAYKLLSAQVDVFVVLIVLMMRSYTDQILLTEGVLLGLPLMLIVCVANVKSSGNREFAVHRLQ